MVKNLRAEKRAHIIVLFNGTPDANDTNIARQAGVAACTVKKIRKEVGVQIDGGFFKQRLKNKSASDLIQICMDDSYDVNPATTKVRNDGALREISKHLLERYRVKSLNQKAKKRVARQYDSDSQLFHGFWLHGRNPQFDKGLVDKFVQRMEDDKNIAHFAPIFEYTQKKRKTAKSEGICELPLASFPARASWRELPRASFPARASRAGRSSPTL